MFLRPTTANWYVLKDKHTLYVALSHNETAPHLQKYFIEVLWFDLFLCFMKLEHGVVGSANFSQPSGPAKDSVPRHHLVAADDISWYIPITEHAGQFVSHYLGPLTIYTPVSVTAGYW